MVWQERTACLEEVAWQADWLSAGERATMRARGGDRGGCVARLLAKQLLAKQLLVECHGSIDHFSEIHIESRDGRDRSTRPQAYIRGRMIPWNISLAHSDRFASAAVLPACDGWIGLDLVDHAALSAGPLNYWLTAAEVERAPDSFLTGLIWSLKEAIYKATNEGTPFFPRRVDTATYLALAEWSRIERDARLQGDATASLSNGWEVSLNVIEGTIKTLVWCPAARRARRVPA